MYASVKIIIHVFLLRKNRLDSLCLSLAARSGEHKGYTVARLLAVKGFAPFKFLAASKGKFRKEGSSGSLARPLLVVQGQAKHFVQNASKGRGLVE